MEIEAVQWVTPDGLPPIQMETAMALERLHVTGHLPTAWHGVAETAVDNWRQSMGPA